jgi:hypothetical protein
LIASATEGFVGVERMGRVPRLGSCPYRALKGEHPNDECMKNCTRIQLVIAKTSTALENYELHISDTSPSVG